MTPDDVRRREHRERREAERAARHATRAGRHSERDTQRADRREVLLDAAINGIRKHGQSASMDVLAAEAGITKPILYRHFGDRAGLVDAIAERFADALQADLVAALGQKAVHNRTLLVNTIEAFVGYIEKDPALYRFLISEGGTETSAVSLTGILEQISNNVALVIGQQMRDAGRDSGGAEVIARGVVAFVYAAGDWWVDRRTMPRDQLVTYMADFLWSGFDGQANEGTNQS
ncbi:MAG: hypothetical protein QOJ00_2134 [Actinomycetota bacterium]